MRRKGKRRGRWTKGRAGVCRLRTMEGRNRTGEEERAFWNVETKKTTMVKKRKMKIQ